MSPANKFWLGVLSIILLFLTIKVGIGAILVLYLIHSLRILIWYAMDYEFFTRDEQRQFLAKKHVRYSLFFIIPYLIKKFNNFINNKYG